jgi:hypothetical protein
MPEHEFCPSFLVREQAKLLDGLLTRTAFCRLADSTMGNATQRKRRGEFAAPSQELLVWPDQPARRLTAFGPLPMRSGSTSNVTFWPSTRVRRPDASTAEIWTKTSFAPPSGVMKP